MNLDKLKYFVFGSAILLLTPSCNKYLDTNPDNRTEINSVDKVAQLVGTAYPAYDYLTFTEAASDNTEDKGPGIGTVTDITSRPYFWQDVAGSNTNTPTNYWTGCYRGVAAANQALEAIAQNNFGTAVLPYKGEALVARAYAHFMLVTLFAKAYVIGGANDSPGIPYVTEPETQVIKQYDRGTVQSTYEKIEKDLTEGMALLSASAYSVPKFHFTPAAAHAFAARFYLFKGDWQKVIDQASAISTESFASIIRPINSTLDAMAYADYKVALTKDDQKYNLLLANQYSTYQRTYPRYGYGANLVKMFAAGYNVTGKAYAFKIASTGVPNYTTGKYAEFFYITNQVANTGLPYIMSPLLTTDEALMNRAEAYARLNQFDNAIKDVNTILSATVKGYVANDATNLDKVKTFYGITDSQEAVIKLILETKKAIFLQEGIRWMDILRNRITVKHNVLDAVGNETFIELAPDDNRRMFQLPEEARLSGVPLNPR
ncbi:RagB/SusD family nutrient uptake outer membrane protein [Pedobacter sp. HDW13]|uniref:RagB/SusD family nutrient uptake outer membrane protein n=1 Tax=unclassified Pedobacter TaxID=2628915 RepID=UPI000F599B11|nr:MULTISPECIES: RagB/SusD family nutrient uptake outer membrane protein [unclassified Pedobacter]QIL38966.1 RagB/SusD family nutrient uptake outer membrane protein [Pedobacter sp. HDW13]RQO72604.1 RagB/SusD family nutrient uptake outer membrane protein [Pedobacter sp. KBW01]